MCKTSECAKKSWHSTKNQNNSTRTSQNNFIYSEFSSSDISITIGHVRELWPVVLQLPQRRARVSPWSFRYLLARVSCLNYSAISLSSIRACASYRLSDPPVYRRDFLRWRRLLSISFAFRSSLTSASNNANLTITLDIPFVNWLIASKIEVGELPWCLVTRSLIKELWEVAYSILLGVWEVHGWAVEGREFRGVGVRNLRSRADITLSGSKGTSPAPLKPP